jgi:hypothetical protein
MDNVYFKKSCVLPEFEQRLEHETVMEQKHRVVCHITVNVLLSSQNVLQQVPVLQLY